MHPGGRSYETFPVNAAEAETRRNSRFFPFGHTPGLWSVPPVAVQPEAPLTLDLRLVPAVVPTAPVVPVTAPVGESVSPAVEGPAILEVPVGERQSSV
jgi:hypothetical protein